ncbi:hypothetical protein, partial [Xylophilus ampelinus]|uniref:hypothetical protein n=1 Tax=Xylophilus ampelinus TaxID=54067 RepID=UPI001F4771B6
YVLRGVNAEKALLAVLRMEGYQPTAAAAGGSRLREGTAAAAAPAVHTPPSNTGVNEVGGGRGLERGYLAASVRIQRGLSFFGVAA